MDARTMDASTVIGKRRNVVSSSIASSVALGGLILLFFPNVPLAISGVIICALALTCLFAGCKEWEYIPEHKALKRKQVYFRHEDLPVLRDICEKREYAKLSQVRKSEHSQGVRVDIFIAKDHSMALMQLYVYVPHEYKPAADLVMSRDTAPFTALALPEGSTPTTPAKRPAPQSQSSSASPLRRQTLSQSI